MKRASGEPAARAAERLIDGNAVSLDGGRTWGSAERLARATPGAMSFDQDELPTAPVNAGVIMTMAQAREALSAFPPDQHPLLWAIGRAFWDDGYMVAQVRGPRVPPADRSKPGESTLAPLGKRGRKG